MSDIDAIYSDGRFTSLWRGACEQVGGDLSNWPGWRHVMPGETLEMGDKMLYPTGTYHELYIMLHGAEIGDEDRGMFITRRPVRDAQHEPGTKETT